jgi:hypothetical protein
MSATPFFTIWFAMTFLAERTDRWGFDTCVRLPRHLNR